MRTITSTSTGTITGTIMPSTTTAGGGESGAAGNADLAHAEDGGEGDGDRRDHRQREDQSRAGEQREQHAVDPAGHDDIADDLVVEAADRLGEDLVDGARDARVGGAGGRGGDLDQGGRDVADGGAAGRDDRRGGGGCEGGVAPT